MPVGIQGCAEIFIEDDGLCHPAVDECPPGQIPKFDEGCVPAGLQGCAEIFIEDDGHCYPSMDKCPEGTFALPLEGCVPIDGANGCGTGTWGNIPDGPATIWVDPSYPGGDGDGSQSKPVGTIAAALDLVVDDGRIALAAATYDEPVRITKAIELVGRCPSMVTISGTQPTPYSNTPVIVTFEGPNGASLRAVRIRGQGIGIVAVSAVVQLHGIHIHQARDRGLLVGYSSSEVVVERSLIQGTQGEVGTGADGYGVCLEQGAKVTLDSSAVVDNRTVGVRVIGSEVSIMRSLIANTLPQQAGLQFGRGVNVEGPHGSAELATSALIGNHEVGLMVEDEGFASVGQSIIARTAPRKIDDVHGEGAMVIEGARLELDASALVDNREAGLLVSDNDSEAALHRSLMTRTRPPLGGSPGGHGAQVQLGARLELSSSALFDNRRISLSIIDAEVHAEQSLIAGTWPEQDGYEGGRGSEVSFGGQLILSSSAVVDNHEAGLVVLDQGSQVTATDSLVADTLPSAYDDAWGNGAISDGGGTLSLNRSAVVRSHVTAVGVWSSTADISGCLLDGVAPGKFHDYDGNTIVATYQDVGDGLVVAFDGHATVTSTRIANCARTGILFESSTGSLSNVASTHSRFGMTLQGDPRPTYDETCVFHGTEKDILADGNLPVPNAPPEMPEAP